MSTARRKSRPSRSPSKRAESKGSRRSSPRNEPKRAASVEDVVADSIDEDSDADPDRDNSDDSDYELEKDDHESESGDDNDLVSSDSDFEKSAPKKRVKKASSPKPTKRPRSSAKPASKTPELSSPASEDDAGEKVPVKATGVTNAAANEAALAAAASAKIAVSNNANGRALPEVSKTKSAVPEGPPMTYVWEIAKTSRAMCKRCDEKIDKETLKIGVVTEGTWGPATQWHHLQCMVFKISTAEEIQDFEDLDDGLKPLVVDRVQKSQGEVDDMYEPISPDDLVRQEWSQKAQCPDDVMATLLPYQAEGLAWMLNQESLPYKGGILADEMGMGKTLQAICTIVANRPNTKDKTMQQRWAKSEEEMGDGGASSKKRGGTLVICPTIALKQWNSELARFVKPGTLKVVIHHGGNRATLAEDLTKADVVLTTYAIIESEHRKAFAGAKVACPDCGKALYPDKMFTHRKYFCGEGAERTEAQAKTQRKKGIAPWRRKDPDAKSKKGKTLDADSATDNGTTDIRVKVKGKGKSKGAGVAKTKGRGKGRKAMGGDESSDDSVGEGGTTNLNVRVKGGVKGKVNSKKGRKRDSSPDEEDAQTDLRSVAVKKGKSKGKAKETAAKGKATRKRKRPKDEDDDEEEDSGSDFEKTTDISGRGKRGRKAGKGKGKGKAKGKGKSKGKAVKRKRAAGESESEWSGDSDKSDSDDSDSDDDNGARAATAKKEAAFAKVLKDMMARKRNAEPGVLQEISWQRIMLDEAHMIKDRSTSTAKAVFALTSLFKWCLTGTPLQNRVGELYSLVRFLRLDPHAFYECRKAGCDCKSLNYRFGPEWRACEECGHTPIMHYAYFNRHILNPISRTGYVGEGKKAFLRLKREVLDQILLRRTKTTRSNDICLPPRIVRVRQHRLDEREEDFYQALYTQSQAQFDTYIDSGTILNNYAHIFDILIRLRQAVDHPYLVIYSSTKREGMTPAVAPAPAASPSPTTGATASARASSPGAPTASAAEKAASNGPDAGASARRSGNASSGAATSHRDEDGALGDTSSDSEADAGVKDRAQGPSGAMSDEEAAEGDDDACGICAEPAERPVSSACGHSFCRTCVEELINSAPGDIECPTCSEPLTVDLSGEAPDDNEGDVGEEAKAGGAGAAGKRRKGKSAAARGRSRSGGRGLAAGGGQGAAVKAKLAGMAAQLQASLSNGKKSKPSGAAKRSITKNSVMNRIDLNNFQSSTKMEALMEEVQLMQERDPAAKAIVFSQFVNMLDLIEYRMQKGQVGCRKLSGHLSVDARDKVLRAFQNDADVKVLLISLKAGGVALNLTVANHIFLMDPWWNPAAEMQAIDRTHRLGQFKPIYATRFIIEDTVEERIIKLQEKKQLVFDSTVGGDAASTGKLTVDDLRFLFAH